MNRVETELLPCPFCGETQMHIEHLDGVYLTHRCEGRSDRPIVKIVDQTEERARSAWNRRTPTAAGGEEAEATVTLLRMGWEEIDDVQTFTATAVFSEPPNWLANIVWESVPVRMAPIRAALSTAGAAEPVAWRYRGHFNGVSLPWQMTDQKWLADRERKNGDEVEPLFASPPSDTEEKAHTRDFWLQYDHQVGQWCVENEPPKVTRSGAEVIHTREIR